MLSSFSLLSDVKHNLLVVIFAEKSDLGQTGGNDENKNQTVVRLFSVNFLEMLHIHTIVWSLLYKFFRNITYISLAIGIKNISMIYSYTVLFIYVVCPI